MKSLVAHSMQLVADKTGNYNREKKSERIAAHKKRKENKIFITKCEITSKAVLHSTKHITLPFFIA
jgi:hypothetical protein